MYDEETRTLRIPVGDIKGNESIKIRYEVKVLNKEVAIEKEKKPTQPKDKVEGDNYG